MRYITDRIVQLTTPEREVHEKFHNLLDQGHGIAEAAAQLDLSTFSQEFVDWLLN